MFAIYRNGNVGFRNTIDNLYKVKKTDSPDNIEMKPDDDTLFQEFLTSKKETDTPSNEEAITAYKKVSNIDTSTQIFHVKDIMTRNCICIRKEKTVMDAYNSLKEHQISQLPIIDLEQKVISLIDKKFILNLIIEDIENTELILNKKLEDLYLNEIITSDPISDIRRVSKVMLDFKLSAIPIVTQEDILVGIVSKSDILEAVANIPKLQLWS